MLCCGDWLRGEIGTMLARIVTPVSGRWIQVSPKDIRLMI
jgi:hypothetical protein